MEADLVHLRRYARTRDPDAFAAIVRLYAGMVFAVARRITRDAHDAEDVVQGCFLSLASHAGQVSSNVGGWLHRTATRRALDFVRDRKRQDRRDAIASVPEASAATDEARRWEQEVMPHIDRAIDDLPDDLKAPLILRYLRSMPQDQVAAQLGVNQSTVSRRLDKAIARVRETLARDGLSAVGALTAATFATLGPQGVPPALAESLTKIAIFGVGREASTTGWAVSVAKALAATVAVVVMIGAVLVIVMQLSDGPRDVAGRTAATRPASVAAASDAVAPPPPTTTTSTPRPTAAELISAVYASERWIDDVESFSIEVEGRWIKSPEAVAFNTARRRKEFPDVEVNERTFPELRLGKVEDKTVIAFDRRRVMSSTRTEGSSHAIRAWDGSKLVSRYQSLHTPDDGYSISPTLLGSGFESSLFGNVRWPRGSPHDFWWVDRARDPSDANWQFFRDRRPMRRRLLDDSKVEGPILFRGKWCWVVIMNEQGYNRWLVGVDDHRLYGTMSGVSPDRAAWEALRLKAAIEVAKAHGATVTTIDGFYEWVQATARRSEGTEHAVPAKPFSVRGQETYDRLCGELNAALGMHDLPPADESWTSDYRQVAPGCWLPFEQGWLNREHENGKTFVNHHHEQTVTAVTVNEPLPDVLFSPEFAEGADVYDRTFSPPLAYKWKANRTAEEWQEIFDEADRRQNESDAIAAALNERVGKPAPAFPPAGTWINSPTLTWGDLRGKVVILDFWAEWCGPCHNDLPGLTAIAEKSAETGIVVVGVHTPGSEDAKLRAHLKTFGINYPVVIDTAPAIGGYGKMSNEFGVVGIPQRFVVGPDGVVAGHGSVGHVMEIARQLKAKASTLPTAK